MLGVSANGSRADLSVRAMHRYRLPAVPASYPPSDRLTAESEPIFDGDEELSTAEEGEMIPYAHRDIKPAYVHVIFVADHRNIMIADDGSPILMDFGSTIK